MNSMSSLLYFLGEEHVGDIDRNAGSRAWGILVVLHGNFSSCRPNPRFHLFFPVFCFSFEGGRDIARSLFALLLSQQSCFLWNGCVG